MLDGSGPREDMCVFQLDLFSAKGPMPETLFDIGQREKDIRYSSRTRLNTDVFRRMQTMRRAIRRLERVLPDDFKSSLDWHVLSIDRLRRGRSPSSISFTAAPPTPRSRTTTSSRATRSMSTGGTGKTMWSGRCGIRRGRTASGLRTE